MVVMVVQGKEGRQLPVDRVGSATGPSERGEAEAALESQFPPGGGGPPPQFPGGAADEDIVTARV